MKIVAGIDDRLLERLARSRQTFQAELITGERFQNVIRAIANWIVANDIEALDGKMNVLERILCDGPLDKQPDQSENSYYA